VFLEQPRVIRLTFFFGGEGMERNNGIMENFGKGNGRKENHLFSGGEE
jgi:hypothetical protein